MPPEVSLLNQGQNTELTIRSLADEWAEGACYYNICGPTEITILNSAHRHVPSTPLSIGKPLPNTTCYILDDEEQPVASGTKGVMWVGGAGVSRGYVNLPELTSNRYKLDKFANDGYICLAWFERILLISNSSSMFCTGDIVAWNVDGSLQMFGRIDDQVKIRVRVRLYGNITQLTLTGLPS